MYKFMSKIYSERLIKDLIDDSVTITELKSKLAKLTEDDFAVVDTVKVEEDDSITIMFPESFLYDVGAEGLQQIVQNLQTTYPNNPVVAIMNNMDVLIQEADQAIEMLEGMIAKIKIVKDTPADKKIITDISW